MQEQPLSVAEIKTLQMPAAEQTQTILHLTLKELALLGWIRVFKGTRPVPIAGYVVSLVFVIVLGIIHPLLLVVGGVYFGYRFFLKDNSILLIEPTSKGRSIPNNPSNYNNWMLQIIIRSVDKSYGNCTVAEWRKSLGEIYTNNADFYKRALVEPLIQRQLLTADSTGNHIQRTTAGETILKTTEQKMQQGANLSYLLRQKSPDAIQVGLALGTLVLLMPELEGYYEPLANMIQEPLDLNQRPPADSGAGDGGSGSIDSGDDNRDQPDNDGLDYGTSSDFLDGSLDGGGSESGCGVGSDGGSDSGGDSGGDGDGGGDGGCGGCGGD